MTPSHAYVPTLTPRHADGTFDTIRATARDGMTVAELVTSAAFATGLRYIDERFFWEAHEVLEPVWLVLPTGSPERTMVQALIQLANAGVKQAMQRPRAAQRLAKITLTLARDATVASDSVMGLTYQDIENRLRHAQKQQDNA